MSLVSSPSSEGQHHAETAAGYVLIAGPTASGKTACALACARELRVRAGLKAEIISCDSVQIYRGFDIGSAKASEAERAEVPHHLIDVVSGGEDFDAFQYAKRAKELIQAACGRGHVPIVVGGTGLYMRALWGYGWHRLPQNPALKSQLQKRPSEELRAELLKLDPQRASELHPNDRLRHIRALEILLTLGHRPQQAPPAELFAPKQSLLLMPERKKLHDRIAQRVEVMLEQGLIGEVQALLEAGVPSDCKPMQSIGYKQVVEALGQAAQGEDSSAQAGLSIRSQGPQLSMHSQGSQDLRDRICAATRQYAKRQCTWFRSMPFDLQCDPTDAAAYADVQQTFIEKILAAQ